MRADRAPGTTDSTGIDLGLVERMSQPTDRVGEILQKRNIDVKADDEGFIFRAQRRFEERSSYLLFHLQDAHLTPARVDEDTESQGEIRFGFEIFDGLWFAILEEVKIFLVEMGNKRAMLVLDVEE